MYLAYLHRWQRCLDLEMKFPSNFMFPLDTVTCYTIETEVAHYLVVELRYAPLDSFDDEFHYKHSA